MDSQNTMEKTVMTYLAPINGEVTDSDARKQYFEYRLCPANEANMKYTTITLDVGAAKNTFIMELSRYV